MKLLELIKKILNPKKKDEEIKKTEIITYDISGVKIPDYSSLEEIDKVKVSKYKENINIKEFDNLLFYNLDISKEGEKISNLLIKFLYELKEIIRKDNKSEEQINEEFVNLSIKNIKIVVLRNILEELLAETILKTVALVEFQKRELQKKHEFLGIFSIASKLKRKSEEESINEAIIRSKITIKTLKDQIKATNSAILTNDTLINQIDIYSNLTDKVGNELIRKKIYWNKLKYFIKVNKFIFDNKLNDLDSLGNLLNKFSEDNELKIIFEIAKIEIDIDKFIYNNKDKMISLFKEELNNLRASKENLERLEKLELIAEVFKDFAEDIDIEKLYRLKFDILTLEVNSNDKKVFDDLDDKELLYYENIIMDMISDVLNGKTKEMKRFSHFGLEVEVISIFNHIFKIDNHYYDSMRIIINNPYYLALLIAFTKENGLRDFFDNFKFKLSKCREIINLYERYYGLKWESNLSVDSICQLIESEIEYDNRKDVPDFYKIYSLLSNVEYQEDENLKYINHIYYKIPNGIIDFGTKWGEDVAIFRQISQKSKGKHVILPSSLSRISDNLFLPRSISGVTLNEGLKSIGDFVFQSQDLFEIRFPSTLENMEDTSFRYSSLRVLEFSDFKNSKLLSDLIWTDKLWTKAVIESILSNKLFKEIVLYDDLNNKYTIECQNIKIEGEVDETKLTTEDFSRARIAIRELIKEKTGYNVPSRENVEERELIKK